MRYVILNLAEAKAHGIVIIPTMRQSVDKTKVVLHEEYIKNIDEFDALQRYEYDNSEFIEMMNSEEWTYGEECVAPDENYSKLLAVRALNTEIVNNINSYNLKPSDALSVKEFYPAWKEEIEVKKGERYLCDELLWECISNHTTQANWKPSLETASLWKVVEIEHEGTQEDPISYNSPMEIFEGKYYTQSEVLYKCTRNSETPLSHNLADLVGIYVEKV